MNILLELLIPLGAALLSLGSISFKLIYSKINKHRKARFTIKSKAGQITLEVGGATHASVENLNNTLDALTAVKEVKDGQ